MAISFRDGELIDDFAMRLTRIVHQLEVLGDPVDDAKVVAKYLQVVPPRSTLMIEEVTGWLKAAEDCLDPGQVLP